MYPIGKNQRAPRLVLGLTTLLLAAIAALTLSVAPKVNAATTAVTYPLIRLQPIASGLSNPIDVVDPRDGTNRLFVIERGGLIRIIQNGVLLDTPFLSISGKVATCGECGLLGLAFPPDFAQSGYFIINYTSNTNLIGPDTGDADAANDTVIARLRVSSNPNVADASSEDPILTINQPAGNHNGGHILFGPDDYLYIGMGDGGGGGDTFQNAQDPASLHGKILRIAVGPTGPYTIPDDNPFIDTADYRHEIWAEGLRNPWRFNFDPTTGDLYIADVGQGNFEEINHVAAADIGNGGMNFGWPIMEGTACFPPSGAQDCVRTGLTEPVAVYDHSQGDCSVTGGYVYHSPMPFQTPVYLFADFCTGRVWGLQRDGDKWVSKLMADYPFNITSFGEDAGGNIYIVSYAGDIYLVRDAIEGLAASNNGPKEVHSTVEFTAIVSGEASLTYQWDFGDGNTSRGITATHTYSESGIYSATVVVDDGFNSMSATTRVYIGDAVVDVTNNAYSPQDITIPVGGKVVWVLREGSHSVTEDNGRFNQPESNHWQPFVQTFDTPDQYQYYCTAHGAPGGLGMSGTVTVEEPVIGEMKLHLPSLWGTTTSSVQQ